MNYASYFGVRKINTKVMDYDYSIIKTGKELNVINETNHDNVRVYICPASLISKNGTLLLECTDRRVLKEKLYLQYYNRNSDILNNIELNGYIELNGKHYLGATIKNLEVLDNVRLTTFVGGKI